MPRKKDDPTRPKSPRTQPDVIDVREDEELLAYQRARAGLVQVSLDFSPRLSTMTMKTKKAHEEHIRDERRAIVSELKLKGYTTRNIRTTLFDLFHRSASGGLLAYQTIENDLIFVREQWRKDVALSHEQYKDQVATEMETVKAAAWAQGDLAIVMKVVEAERRLFGLDAPTKITPVDENGDAMDLTQPIQIEFVSSPHSEERAPDLPAKPKVGEPEKPKRSDRAKRPAGATKKTAPKGKANGNGKAK